MLAISLPHIKFQTIYYQVWCVIIYRDGWLGDVTQPQINVKMEKICPPYIY